MNPYCGKIVLKVVYVRTCVIFLFSSHRQKPPKRPKPIVNLANTHRKVSSLKVYEVPLNEFIGRQCNVELIVKVFYCLSLAKYDLNIASSRRSVIWGTARKTAREKNK